MPLLLAGFLSFVSVFPSRQQVPSWSALPSAQSLRSSPCCDMTALSKLATSGRTVSKGRGRCKTATTAVGYPACSNLSKFRSAVSTAPRFSAYRDKQTSWPLRARPAPISQHLDDPTPRPGSLAVACRSIGSGHPLSIRQIITSCLPSLRSTARAERSSSVTDSCSSRTFATGSPSCWSTIENGENDTYLSVNPESISFSCFDCVP